MSLFNLNHDFRSFENNLAGGRDFNDSVKYKLISILLTSFVKDKFYRAASDELEVLRNLLLKIDLKFAAQSAIFARQEYGMRSITHAIAGELAFKIQGKTWARDFFYKIIKRPDDILEILAYIYGKAKIRKIPNALKAGFAKKLSEFDEYQLGKYQSKNKVISLIDAVNLLHPKSTPALNKLMKGQLKNDSAIAFVSRQIHEGISTNDAWTELIKSRKIGYLALLRNLSNIIKHSPESVGACCEMLQDKNLIKKSLIFPFQFWITWKQLKENIPSTHPIFFALLNACNIALSNVPTFEGKTLIAVDKSGSMSERLDIATQFASVLWASNKADLILFDDKATLYKMGYPLVDVMKLQESILLNCRNNGGTDFCSVFNLILENNKQAKNFQTFRPVGVSLLQESEYSRIVFITDDQHWGGDLRKSYDLYCKKTNSRPFLYLIDVFGYGTLSFPQDRVYSLVGFSDKIFDTMKVLEQDPFALINTIEKITLDKAANIQ